MAAINSSTPVEPAEGQTERGQPPAEKGARVPAVGGDLFGIFGRATTLTIGRVGLTLALVFLLFALLGHVSWGVALAAWLVSSAAVIWPVVSRSDEIDPPVIEAAPPVEPMAVAQPVQVPTSEPVWQTIIDAYPDPAIVLDGEQYVLHFNPPLADLFVKARPGVPLTTLTRSPALLTALETFTADDMRRVVQIEDRIPILRKWSAIITPIHLGADDPQNLRLVVLRDLTAEQQHAQLRSDFIAHASHELRTPLASLKSMVETLQGPAHNDVEARGRFLAMIQEQASRMARLIDDLLVLSRAEMRVHLPPTSRVDLRNLLAECVETMQPLAQARGNELLLEADDENLIVTGDRDDLVQIFLNLLQNAIKYGRDDAKVRITARRLERPGRLPAVEVSVIDQGPGIAKEHIPRITERFYRVSVTASRNKGGTGLGLAIVKYLLNRHKGRLDITSEVGVGSTFKITLNA